MDSQLQYGRIHIEKVTKKKTVDEPEENVDDREKDSPPPSPHIINKESLILVPNGEPLNLNGQISDSKKENINVQVLNNGTFFLSKNLSKDKNCTKIILNSFDSIFNKGLDFKIEDCLEYLKSGIEAIIEDDVTSRFEEVELENWNLLTRNNQRFNCIPWNLKCIWIFGFVIRYFILMPFRALICFIGVSPILYRTQTIAKYIFFKVL